MYKFTERAGDLEELVLSTFDSSLLLPSADENIVELFQNGDRMTINLKERTMVFDGVRPTDLFSSKLNRKRHQWFAEWVIEEINP